MKNGEAGRPHDGSLECDQSRGEVTFLCLTPAGTGTNHFWGYFSVIAWFAPTRATSLSTHREDFPGSPKEMLTLSCWVWVFLVSFESAGFAVQMPLNDFACWVFCLFSMSELEKSLWSLFCQEVCSHSCPESFSWPQFLKNWAENQMHFKTCH